MPCSSEFLLSELSAMISLFYVWLEDWGPLWKRKVKYLDTDCSLVLQREIPCLGTPFWDTAFSSVCFLLLFCYVSFSMRTHMTWFIKKYSWATCECLTSNAADNLQSHVLVQNLVQFFEINPADSQGPAHHPSRILRHKSFWWALGSKEQLIKASVNLSLLLLFSFCWSFAYLNSWTL